MASMRDENTTPGKTNRIKICCLNKIIWLRIKRFIGVRFPWGVVEGTPIEPRKCLEYYVLVPLGLEPRTPTLSDPVRIQTWNLKTQKQTEPKSVAPGWEPMCWFESSSGHSHHRAMGLRSGFSNPPYDLRHAYHLHVYRSAVALPCTPLLFLFYGNMRCRGAIK